MTTYFRKTKACAVCGHASEHTEIGSTNILGGYRDLDTRPPEMMRSTIIHWVQRCPHCGYAASDISDATSATEEWLQSDEYLDHDGILPDDWPDDCLEVMFYRAHKAALHDGDTDAAAMALLHAAWACDDLGKRDEAKRLREASVPLFKELLRDEPDNDSLQIIILDVMRRAGMFEQVKEEYHEGMFDGDVANRIVAFQLERVAEGDDRTFTVGHAMGELPVTDFATERMTEEILRQLAEELNRKFHAVEELVVGWVEDMIDRLDQKEMESDEDMLAALQAELDAVREENENGPAAQVLRAYEEEQQRLSEEGDAGEGDEEPPADEDADASADDDGEGDEDGDTE